MADEAQAREGGTDARLRGFVRSPEVGGIFQEIGGAATLSVLPAPDTNHQFAAFIVRSDRQRFVPAALIRRRAR